jgi:ElaB/YqjD/DUF883 family membrane-anchored ribosome-binding protein
MRSRAAAASLRGANNTQPTRKRMTTSTRSIRTQSAAHALADDAMDKVRDLRYGVQDLASKSLSAVGDTAHVAQQRLGQYANTTGRYVTEQPVKSALIAAAVGAAVAALVLAARSRRRRTFY